MFSWSANKQLANPKKVYAIDAAFAVVPTACRLVKTLGRRLKTWFTIS
jgi:hypothetical protein